MLKYATLFSGGGIFELGLRGKAKLVFGVEKDSAIASVWRENHNSLLYVDDLLLRDSNSFPDVDYIHASPPCQNFSIANSLKGKESNVDIALAKSIYLVLKRNKADYFTLENVPAYSKSKSFQIICDRLTELGYYYTWQVLNLAHYGVPQSRRRLFLMAKRVQKIHSEFCTLHSELSSWYNVIADLIPSLPIVEPTEKEKAILDKFGGQILICDRYQLTTRLADKPCFTIKASIGTDGKGARRSKFIDMYDGEHWRTLSTRAIARMQTIPDRYVLPSDSALALKVIGNGVPSAFAGKLFDAITRADG